MEVGLHWRVRADINPKGNTFAHASVVFFMQQKEIKSKGKKKKKLYLNGSFNVHREL